MILIELNVIICVYVSVFAVAFHNLGSTIESGEGCYRYLNNYMSLRFLLCKSFLSGTSFLTVVLAIDPPLKEIVLTGIFVT